MAPDPISSVPLLNLDTLIDRAVIRINGTTYPLRNRGELSLLADRRFSRASMRFNELWNLEVPTEADDQELSRLIRSMCEIVLDASAEVHAVLGDPQRMEIVEAFLELRLRPARPVGAMTTANQEATPTGASSSHG